MIRYKILDAYNEIIGIATEETISYVEFNKHQIPRLTRNAENAFGISFNGVIYSFEADVSNYSQAKVIPIGITEYEYLEPILNNKIDETQSIPNENIIQDIEKEVDTSTINCLIKSKISEMKNKCNQAIISGVDITLSNNETYHFDLTIEDQLNLQNIQFQLSRGETLIPFHYKNGEFKYFTVTDLNIIILETNKHILYHNVYFNSLKQYIKSLTKLTKVDEVYYGMNIPKEYKSEILNSLEK